eukprot:5181458-Amphidinium_carterae.1
MQPAMWATWKPCYGASHEQLGIQGWPSQEGSTPSHCPSSVDRGKKEARSNGQHLFATAAIVAGEEECLVSKTYPSIHRLQAMHSFRISFP